MQLSIVIVSHGHEAFLPGCIASLDAALAGVTYELIVIDNLPDGRAQALLEPRFPAATWLTNAAPVGLSENCNRAAARARGEYLLFLNPDTVHQSGLLADAIAYLRDHPDVGLLGCRLLNADGTVQQNYRRFPTLPVIACRALGADRWPWQPEVYRTRMMFGVVFEQPSPVDWVFGAFMLVSAAHFASVGGMDPGFHLYYEDVDLCYRLRENRLRTVLFPGLRFIHSHMRSSARQIFGQAWRWHLRSAVRILRKHRYLLNPPAESRWN